MGYSLRIAPFEWVQERRRRWVEEARWRRLETSDRRPDDESAHRERHQMHPERPHPPERHAEEPSRRAAA
ncbi:hypothetical protein GCM10009747_32300 [Agromyces humatus]|uniref:Uncharacterized protein n=1 Tax=Agromyces humatus TaxID=279573 RepID=A0ABP4X2L5_9MICO